MIRLLLETIKSSKADNHSILKKKMSGLHWEKEIRDTAILNVLSTAVLNLKSGRIEVN